MCEAQRVLLPNGAIYLEPSGAVADLLSDLLAFPVGRRKDIVDAFVYGGKKFMGILRTGKAKSKRSKIRAADAE